MYKSSDNLSESSLDEVLRAEIENRTWGKTLRHRSAELLNRRMAKSISLRSTKCFANRTTWMRLSAGGKERF
jgi:hypothetical protein